MRTVTDQKWFDLLIDMRLIENEIADGNLSNGNKWSFEMNGVWKKILKYENWIWYGLAN